LLLMNNALQSRAPWASYIYRSQQINYGKGHPFPVRLGALSFSPGTRESGTPGPYPAEHADLDCRFD
jgi:hypothetical protein